MARRRSDWRLYAPPAYAAELPRDIVRRYPFATLVSSDPSGRPFLTQTPIYFASDADDEPCLVGHLARNNPHADQLTDNGLAVAHFTGPHAYISASWYVERPTVPTWNYVSAQVRGRISVIDDREGQRGVLERVIALSEEFSGSNWTMNDAPDGRVEALLPHIRSFRLEIESIAGVTKLSQTHPVSDRLRVADALETRNSDDDAAIAAMIRSIRS